MPELVDVVAAEPIESVWGNAIRDRTILRYADSAARAAADPTPEDGSASYLADTGDIEVFHSAAWRALLPVGVVLPYSGSSAPAGFLLCDGSAVSRTTYARLNSLYSGDSYPYGSGNGTTTFNVPDLRQRFPMGKAASGTGNALGSTFGTIDHVHTGPSHTHAVGTLVTASGGSHAHTLNSGDTSSAGSHTHSFSDTSSGASGGGFNVGAGGNNVSSQSHTHTVSGTTGSGGSHSHTINTGMTSAGSHTHTISGSTAAGGTGNTGQGNPPGIALNFIVKV